MRCEPGFFSYPGNRSSSETNIKTNSVRKTRLQPLLCKPSIDNFEKAHLTMFFGNVRMNTMNSSDLVLLRSLPFSLNLSEIAPLMVNVAVSVSEDVLWKPKWPK